MMAAVAMELHTALDRERAGIVVICAIRRRTAGGDHRDSITRIIKTKRLIESNPSPKSMAGKNSERKSNDTKGSSEGGEENIFPGCRKEKAGECAAAEADRWDKIPRPNVFHVNTTVFHIDTKINLFARK